MTMNYESVTRKQSATATGVTFTIARMSFGRRVELMRQLRELAGRVEFLEAGKDAKEQMDAALVKAEIDRIYVKWGLLGVEGLELDGQPATPEQLADTGPEELFHEALAAIKAETELNETERKN